MSILTKDVTRVYELGDINELPVAAGELIYQGAVIGYNSSGYVRNLNNTDNFAGFAEDHIDNSTGLDGAKRIRIRKRGSILLEITGITLTDLGRAVYATNNNSFTLSPTNAVYIGQISKIEDSGLAVVEFAFYPLVTGQQ